MKKCSKCEKEIEDFNLVPSELKLNSDDCNQCEINNKPIYDKKASDNKKLYYINNRDDILAKRKSHRELNKEKLIEKSIKYYYDNRETILKQKSEYGIKNKDKINAYKKERRKRKIKENPILKIRVNISVSIRSYLKNNNFNKNKLSLLKYVPWKLEELKLHIEYYFSLPGNEWMNWTNQGNYRLKDWDDNDKSTWKWQLDHIIPHSYFKYNSMEDPLFKECWALSNLRPYSAKQNNIDGHRLKSSFS